MSCRLAQSQCDVSMDSECRAFVVPTATQHRHLKCLRCATWYRWRQDRGVRQSGLPDGKELGPWGAPCVQRRWQGARSSATPRGHSNRKDQHVQIAAGPGMRSGLVKQHACSDCHKLAVQAWPDASVRLYLQSCHSDDVLLRGAVPQLTP